MAGATGFFRKNGKIVPIRAAAGAGVAAAGAAVAHNKLKSARAINAAVQLRKHPNADKKIHVNRSLDMTGLGLSVASGVVAASTFALGAAGLATGFVASHVIDAGGVAANAASVAGHGHKKERAKVFAKQEGRNFAIGNAVYLGGVLGTKTGRESLVKYSAKILEFGRKALRVI